MKFNCSASPPQDLAYVVALDPESEKVSARPLEGKKKSEIKPKRSFSSTNSDVCSHNLS